MKKSDLASCKKIIESMIQDQLIAMVKFSSENTRYGIDQATLCRKTADELINQLKLADVIVTED